MRRRGFLQARCVGYRSILGVPVRGHTNRKLQGSQRFKEREEKQIDVNTYIYTCICATVYQYLVTYLYNGIYLHIYTLMPASISLPILHICIHAKIRAHACGCTSSLFAVILCSRL